MPRSRLLGCAFLLILSVATSTKLLAQQTANEVKRIPSPPAKLLEVKAVEQHAAYWSSESGWDTELQLRNNLSSEPLSVTPVLRLSSGQEISLDAVNIPANGSISVSVNAGLQEHAPNVVGRPGSYGSVVFRFQARNAMNLYATAVPAMESLPISFRIPARSSNSSDTLPNNRPGSLEGIWWKARTGLTDVLIIANSSNAEISGILSLFDSGGKRWSEPLTLASHQIARIVIPDLLQTAGLAGNFGGFSFEVPALVSALDAVHLMYDQGGKFSGSLEVFHRDPSATVFTAPGRHRNAVDHASANAGSEQSRPRTWFGREKDPPACDLPAQHNRQNGLRWHHTQLAQ